MRAKSLKENCDEKDHVQTAGLLTRSDGRGINWRRAGGVIVCTVIVCASGDIECGQEIGASGFAGAVGKIRDQGAGFEARGSQFGDGGAVEDAARDQRRVRAEDRGGPPLPCEDGPGAQERYSASRLQ